MTRQPVPPADVRRHAARPVSAHGAGVSAAHSFSFGSHYDPANLGFGPMVCHDEHSVAPGRGYADHPHADVEIVTWVLDGALVHRSPVSASHTLGPGGAQALSAGSGVVHAETADPAAGPTRFVQTWLRPDVAGLDPAYAATPAGEIPTDGAGLVPVAGAGSALPVGVAGATLWLTRGLNRADGTAGGELLLPDAPLLHAYLPRGTATLEDGTSLGPGDAVRLWEAGGARLALDADAELLVWSFAARR